MRGDALDARGVIALNPPQFSVHAKAHRNTSIARRVVLIAAALAVATFAIQGGEWGTFDILSQGKRVARLETAVDSLQHVVDSLRLYRKRIDTDPVLQERIAREDFGMVRGSKELLYRFTDQQEPATGRRD